MIAVKYLRVLPSLTKCAGLFLLIGVLASCDSTEDNPWYLSLAGRYTGDVIVSDQEVSITGTMIINVEQSGDQVTLSGTIQLLGQSSTFAAFTGTVNNTGFFTLTGGGYSGTLEDPDCGEVTGFSESIKFFENESLEIVENYVYQLCGEESFKAVLHRS